MQAFVALILVLIAGLLLSLLLAYPAMLLWNGALIFAIPMLQPVTWLQMFGILLLASLFRPVDISKKDK